jgi:hypothetical protein
MTSPTIKGRVVSPTLRAAGETWRDLAVDYDFGGIPARSQGTVDARVRSPWDNVVLKARLAGTKDGRLAIDGLELATLKSRLTGAVSLDTGTGLMQGKLALSTPDLAPWSAVLGMPTGGAVSGTLILRPAKGGQDAVLDIEGHRLRIVPTGAAPIAVDRATAKISIASLLATPRVDGAVGLVGFARQDQRLATVEAHLKGGRDRLAFDLTAAGAKGTPVDITTAGWLALGDGTTDLAVTKLSGAAYGQQIALAAPARFHRGPDGLAADDFTLQVGQGIVVGNARLSNRTRRCVAFL